MYTVRWYTYDRTHVLDEECEDTSQVAFWSQPSPTAPIFAHTTRDSPEEWKFDLKELQAAVRQEPTSAIVACVWTDAFQNIPETRNFALVITRSVEKSIDGLTNFSIEYLICVMTDAHSTPKARNWDS